MADGLKSFIQIDNSCIQSIIKYQSFNWNPAMFCISNQIYPQEIERRLKHYGVGKEGWTKFGKKQLSTCKQLDTNTHSLS